MKSALIVSVLGALLVLTSPLSSGASSTPAQAQDEFVPVIFVHGFVGSGAQYQSQAMRFASNGYPAGYVRVFEYNSLDAGADVVQPLLDAFTDDVRDELGVAQVHMVGHSLGTTVMQAYLNSSPERADRVDKYINIDGRTGDAPPGGVPTLAIWGMGDPDREIVGAENVYFSDQTHTEVVTSPESFAAQYEFLTGEPPATTEVQPEAAVEIAGRAVVFPENAGIEGATLEIWAVDGESGARTDTQPVASYILGADGAWGPLAVDGSQQLEFLILRQDSDIQHHIYMQAFTRSNDLIRLLSVEPDSPIAQNIEGSERHTTVTVIRYKEWWGDDPGGANDTLEFNDTNVINPATSPISNRTIGIHAFDRGSDSVTDVSEPDEFFFELPFQTGVDIYMPASSVDPPDGTICVANAPRGDGSSMQVINVSNWSSSEHRVSVEFTDFVREGDPACGVAAQPEATPTEPAPTPELQLPDAGSGPAVDAGGSRAVLAAIAAAAVMAFAMGALAVASGIRKSVEER